MQRERPAARDPARRAGRLELGAARQRALRARRGAARRSASSSSARPEGRGRAASALSAARSASTSAPSRRARCSSTAPTGASSATSVYPYAHGVIDAAAARARRRRRARAGLGAAGSATTTSRASRTPFRAAARRDRRRSPAEVVGIGIDFTVVHDAADARRRHAALPCSTTCGGEPHAWVKLWKHHAAQPEADRINAVAAERGEPWLRALRRQDLVRVVLRQGAADPRRGAGGLRARRPADRGGRLGRLAAHRRRDAKRCTAGYKAMWSKRDGFPAPTTTSPRSTRASSTSSTRRCRATIVAARRAGRRARASRRPPGRACGRDAGRGRERRRPRLGAGGDRHRARDDGR